MANVLSKRVLIDGWRNAVVKLTGVLTDSDIAENPAVSLADFINNEKVANLSGLRVDRITYVIGNGLEAVLEWDGITPEQIVAIAGRGVMEGYHFGGYPPNQANPSYNGSINLRTSGFGLQPVPGTPQNFTVTLEMTKLYRV